MTSLDSGEASDLFRRDPEQFIDVGAGEVAYRRVGTGPDVLFVHGWPVSGATWRTVLPFVAEHVACHVIDLPGAGSSRFDPSRHEISFDQHIETVRRVINALDVDDIAVVGHDSGGMIVGHAVAGHGKVRAVGLVDTEQLRLGWRFKSFLVARHLPGFAASLRATMKSKRIRRQPLVLGGVFEDRSLLDGEFDEFFLRPIVESDDRLAAAVQLLDSFESRHVDELEHVHSRLDLPVQLVWGVDDPFFPVAWAHQMVPSFRNAQLTVVNNARLFSHEERPAEVATALLPTLLGERT